jgi:hypothetical protein
MEMEKADLPDAAAARASVSLAFWIEEDFLAVNVP